MPATQTSNGKAFEYACLLSIYETLNNQLGVTIVESPQLETAKNFYENLETEEKEKFSQAAMAAARAIVRLEPQLQHNNLDVPLYIAIQTDSTGIAGDVRDVLCIRNQNDWQIGLSCKHNHHAVKHSRLSASIDFGQEWLSSPCSDNYFSEVVPIFTELRDIRDSSKEAGTPALWRDIPDKAERYYLPILNSFLTELNSLASTNPQVPSNLIHYLLGRYDFYKVITDDKRKTTRVEAVNIAGTLNRSFGSNRSIVNVPQIALPTRFYHTGIKQHSDNTAEVICDEGWQISLRIHNASSKVEPSLKFDVNLISLPSSIHAQVEPW